MNPGKRKAPEGTGADAITRHHRPQDYSTPPHQVYMAYTLGTRLRWLERHEHWWIREVRRHQAACERCDRCDGAAA